MIISFIGPLLPVFRAKWGLDDGRSGLFSTTQFLVSLAAMQHFLSDDQAALETLAKAKKETFTDPEKDVHGYDQYLNQLIDEYIEKIKSHSVPADDQDESS